MRSVVKQDLIGSIQEVCRRESKSRTKFRVRLKSKGPFPQSEFSPRHVACSTSNIQKARMP